MEPELSYAILGASFEVYNALGPGYSEAYYQRALAAVFQEKGIAFKREVLLPVKFHNQCIGRQRCDFLVGGKVLVEIKKGNTFSRHNIEQVLNYLWASGLKLAILINVAPQGILYKRVVNTDSYIRTNS